jgi:hypothetical protein
MKTTTMTSKATGAGASCRSAVAYSSASGGHRTRVARGSDHHGGPVGKALDRGVAPWARQVPESGDEAFQRMVARPFPPPPKVQHRTDGQEAPVPELQSATC